MGYDEAFRRLWTLYLSYCEAGFAERRIGNVQVLLGKPRHRLGHAEALGSSGAAAPHATERRRSAVAPGGGSARSR
jgi:cyclopropane-fatty-acyl-phospholipid synthase